MDRVFTFQNNKRLTDEELLYLLENDDPEYENYEADASDIEETDIITEEDEEDDVIYANHDAEFDAQAEVHVEMETDTKVDNEAEAVSDNFDENIPQYVAKDGTKWFKIPISKQAKLPKPYIRKSTLGLTSYSSGISDMKDAFLLFFSPDIIDTIVTETNRKAEFFYSKWNNKNPNKTRTYTPVDAIEIKAYMGLLLTLGALHCSKEPIDMLWCHNVAYSRPIIPATMSRDRYKEITIFLRFDNFETREERKKLDKLAPIRNVFDSFVANCKKSLNPSTHLCVDEQLVPFRGRAPFRVYMKSKPDKYGIKIWALSDCDNFYTSNMQVYLGKQGKTPEKNQGLRVVLDMVQHLPQGCGITTDNFFTSMQLADELWKKNMTLCGTLRKNKTFIPQDLLPKPYKKPYTSMFAFRKNRTLVSYVPKEKAAVILLSSEHRDDTVATEDESHKPEIILHYNKTKGAVDATDKLAKEYSTQRKTNRWPMAIFYHLIDIAGINAYKLWLLAKPDWLRNRSNGRKIFLLELGKQMIKENVVRRYSNRYIQSSRKRCMTDVFPELLETLQERAVSVTGGKTRCYMCQRKKDRKSKNQCVNCNNFVCKEHSVTETICNQCKN